MKRDEQRKRPLGLTLFALYLGALALVGLFLGSTGILVIITLIADSAYDDTFTPIFHFSLLIILFLLSVILLWLVRGLWKLDPKARTWIIWLSVFNYFVSCLVAFFPTGERPAAPEDCLYTIPLLSG